MPFNTTQPLVHTIYHVDLSDTSFQEEYWVEACDKRYPLLPHTSETRKRTRLSALHLQDIPDHRLTHYTALPVEFPADHVAQVTLKHAIKALPGIPKRQRLDHVAIHIPPTPEQRKVMAMARTMPQQMLCYGSTARALVFHQANLLHVELELASMLYAYMVHDRAINTLFDKLAEVLRQIRPLLGNASWETLLSFPPMDLSLSGDHAALAKAPHLTPIADITAPVLNAILNVTQKDLRLHRDCA